MTEISKAALGEHLAVQELNRNIAKADVLRKTRAALELAEVAEQIQKRDGGTYEQSVLVALENDPGLYQP